MDIRRHFLHVRANSTKHADFISQSRRYRAPHPGNSREKNIPLRKPLSCRNGSACNLLNPNASAARNAESTQLRCSILHAKETPCRPNARVRAPPRLLRARHQERRRAPDRARPHAAHRAPLLVPRRAASSRRAARAANRRLAVARSPRASDREPAARRSAARLDAASRPTRSTC